MITAIIFDFDGVLFDSEVMHYQAANAIFTKLSFALSPAEYLEKYVGLSDEEMFPIILANNGFALNQSEIDKLIADKTQTYKKMIAESDNVNCMQGADELLKIAASKISKFGICSNSSRLELQAALSRMQRGTLQQYFQCITTIDDVKQGKPSPEGYLKTAKHLQVDPENCLVIEDSQHGIKAANAANMQVIGIATTHTRAALSEANYIMQDFAEIKQWFIQLEM